MGARSGPHRRPRGDRGGGPALPERPCDRRPGQAGAADTEPGEGGLARPASGGGSVPVILVI